MSFPFRAGKSRASLTLPVAALGLLLLVAALVAGIAACNAAGEPRDTAAPVSSTKPVETVETATLTAPATPAGVAGEPAAKSAPAGRPPERAAPVEPGLETAPEIVPETAAKPDNAPAQATEPVAAATPSVPPVPPMEPEAATEPPGAATDAATPVEPPTATAAAVEPTALPEPPPATGSRVGNRIPAFTLELTDGATVSSASLVEQEKPAFLFFFATT